jgi:hypothetical protein
LLGWEEVAGGWRRLHDEELHTLYASPDSFRMIKSKSMRWAEHVERMVDRRKMLTFWLEDLNGRDHSEDLCADGKIILEWILKK